MICSRCIMDDTVPGIWYDEKGECNFCKIHDESEKQYPQGEKGKRILDHLVKKIKSRSNGDYDCLIGISGGTDSSYALKLTVELGLNPLAYHVDNFWNTDASKHNVKRITDELGVDLLVDKPEWNEFRDLQLSFFKASVPDMEAPTDLALISLVYKTAKKHGLKYIIDGQAFRVAGKTPIFWGYMDGKYIRGVHEEFGIIPLSTYPNMSYLDRIWYMKIDGINHVSPLNYVEYDWVGVKKMLERELRWKDYGAKHYESIYTRFIQSNILPNKFNIDKRKVYYSALIRSGQMNRSKAIDKILKNDPYPKDKIVEDQKYIIKNLEIDEREFYDCYNKKPKCFLDYPNNYAFASKIIKLGILLNQLPPRQKYYEWDVMRKDVHYTN